jgi:hypothetical protein
MSKAIVPTRDDASNEKLTRLAVDKWELANDVIVVSVRRGTP